METFLTALSGLAWTVVYIASIWIGLKQKTYAMPVAALGLNIAWEWTYAIHDLRFDPGLQAYVNLTWALADVAILYTFFRFGRSELPKFVSRPMFIAWGIAILAASITIQLLFLVEFGMTDHLAPRYSAFLQNLLMSGLFIAMFVGRRGSRGQSLTIAIAKWIGTLAPALVMGVIHYSPFILGIGMLCSVFDLAYIALLLWARNNPDLLAAQSRQHATPDPRLAAA